MRHVALAALLLSPVLAKAGVIYQITVRSVDQTNMAPDSPAAPAPTPVVREYFVEDGKVRAGGAHAKTVFLFKDQTVYVIDHPARTVRVLKRVTLRQVAAHYADVVKQLEEAAARAPPEERAEALRKVADMREMSDRMRQPVIHEYRVTVRSESVDGHACRIWEEHEKDAKRLEICVAPASELPGGAEILNGMKTLAQFRQGSMVAIGVDFGLSEWWPEFASLEGVPLLVREFKFDSMISELTLTGVRQGVPSASLLNLPDGYQVEDGPDYVQWYMR